MTAVSHILISCRYPYDNPTGDYGTTTEDNNLFFEIANAYASANSILSGGVKCNSHSYGAGVVNGAEWKNIRNTLQDYLYTQKSEFMVRIIAVVQILHVCDCFSENAL